METLDPILRAARRGKIDFWMNTFSSEADPSTCRFIAEMIWGISFAGSVRLSRIARSLEEAIPERATIKRLSRNLGQEGLADLVGGRVQELGAGRIRQDTLLIVHRYSLLKRHAKNMEFLDDIRDRFGRIIGKGYQLCEVTGWDPESKEVTSLAEILWSRNAPDFDDGSELSLINRVRRASQGRGIIAGITPTSDSELLVRLTGDPASRYMFQMPPESRLLYSRRPVRAIDLVTRCKTRYGDTVFHDYENKESEIFVHYGFLPVRLPECPDRPLWLVIIKGFDERFAGKNPSMLLTTEPMRQNRKVLWRMVEGHFTTLWVQSTNYLIRQRCDLEDVRVRSYTRLKNLSALVLAASYFTTVFGQIPFVPPPVRFKRRDHGDT